MPCLDDNRVAAFFDGTLSEAERAAVEAHIDDCEPCRRLLSDAAAAWAAVAGTEQAETIGVARPAPPPPEPELGYVYPGAKIGPFEVERKLGRGGMGEVYLARDTRLDRHVALKLVQSDLLSTGKSVDRFLIEAKATARFNHPNIISIFDVGQFRGRPYVALEYLEGETLRERLKRGPIPLDDAIEIARGIAAGLAEAHRHSILHRDLKPSNVMLLSDKGLRVLDFGLAKMIDDNSQITTSEALSPASMGSDLTTAGLLGTPRYMAPELWQAAGATPQSDIWAWGLITAEMVCPEHPLKGKDPQAIQKLLKTSTLSVDLPRTLPAGLAALIRGALASDPGQRPSASTIVESLARLQRPASNLAIRTLVVALLLLAVGVPTALWLQQKAPTPKAPLPTQPQPAPNKNDVVTPTPDARPVAPDSTPAPPDTTIDTRVQARAKRRNPPPRPRRKRFGQVRVQTTYGGEPMWAEVYLDGKYRGQTPLVLGKVVARRHKIRVSRSGYKSQSKRFTLAPNQALRLRFSLSKR